MLNQLIKAAFQFGLNSCNYLQFNGRQPFAAKRDNSEVIRAHITKSGEVTYRPYPMSFSRSIVGLTVIVDNTKQGVGITNILAARLAA